MHLNVNENIIPNKHVNISNTKKMGNFRMKYFIYFYLFERLEVIIIKIIVPNIY
jgi:hypothetical protein